MVEQQGDLIAGYKIGLTSDRMQELLEIKSPIAGVVLKKRIKQSGAIVESSDYGRLGLECEIVAEIAEDLPPGPAKPYDFEKIGASVSCLRPAFEIIDDRNADYKDIDVFSLIADNSWNAGLIVGPGVQRWGDLAKVEGQLRSKGKIVDAGKGADVLGHPFLPIVWLANSLSSRGLRKGDCVATGSIVPTIFPKPGESYIFLVSGLGSVDVEIH